MDQEIDLTPEEIMLIEQEIELIKQEIRLAKENHEKNLKFLKELREMLHSGHFP